MSVQQQPIVHIRTHVNNYRQMHTTRLNSDHPIASKDPTPLNQLKHSPPYLEVDELPFVGNLPRLGVVVVAIDFLQRGVRAVHYAPIEGEAGRVVAAELLSYRTTHNNKKKSRKVTATETRREGAREDPLHSTIDGTWYTAHRTAS